MNFSLPVICVGNITVGGTGKSPHIEYLIELLHQQYQLATLSRGYGRKSRGFRLASPGTNAHEIGDEPFQFKTKYPLVEVCVAEERMTAIPQLLQRKPRIQVILLDDAFQHRTVRAGLNILLTDYDRLFTRDFIMPFGLLRESRKAYHRAEIIIVSKCPEQLTMERRNQLVLEIAPLPHQEVYFTKIAYARRYPLLPDLIPSQPTSVLMVTAIANPKPLEKYLLGQYQKVFPLTYKDHHYFSTDDIHEIHTAFKHLSDEQKIIVTTEKDASRLMLHQDLITSLNLPIYVQSIAVEFLFNGQEAFNKTITNFVEPYYPPLTEEEQNALLYPKDSTCGINDGGSCGCG